MFVYTNYTVPEGVVYSSNLSCADDVFSLDACSATDIPSCPGSPLGLTCYITGILNFHMVSTLNLF